MPYNVERTTKTKPTSTVEQAATKISITDGNEITSKTKHADDDDDCRADKIFYRICYFCFILGINFYRSRSAELRRLSVIILSINFILNIYFVGYVLYLTLSKPFEAERVAVSISRGTWVVQSSFATLFLAWWQHTDQPSEILKLLYEANKGAGIHYHRKRLSLILSTYYVVIVLCALYDATLITANLLEINLGYADPDIPKTVAIFIFSVLIHSTHYEFLYYNEQVRMLKCNEVCKTDEALCDYLLKLIKVHNRLTEVVKRLDKMFHRYAFVMIATIIPTTIFSLFMVVHRPKENFGWELVFSLPLVLFCIFSFFALVNAPSQLHDTIYNTKSALCANTHIWYPYRPNVYHSALAFVCHLDQTNLGVSIWGFAVVSKPLVLTTLSVMVTSLALFLQVGECNTGLH